jgi:hypothetical protein
MAVFCALQRKSERVMTAGSTIMEIGQPEALEIVVDLLSQDAVKVEAGARAYLENWGGDVHPCWPAHNGWSLPALRKFLPSGWKNSGSM